MFHQREGFVETVQQELPFLITVGVAETQGMVFQFPPFHQQQVAPLLFEAGADLQLDEAGRFRNEG